MPTTRTESEPFETVGEKLKGRVAMVTGGTRGIGAAICHSLAAQGAAVAAGYGRDRERAEAFQAELSKDEIPVSIHQGNVGSAEDCRRTVQEVIDHHGRLDILVNNAGITSDKTIFKMTDEDWYKVLAVNLSGVFYATREALPEMADRGWGRVIHIASIAGKTAMPYIAAYVASKHGVLGLTKVAALEMATRGVTVNAVCPGFVDTPMTDAGIANMVAKTGKTAADIRLYLEGLSPQKRLVTAEEVAALAVFLCGDDARGITGQALNVDGGTVL